MEEALEDVPFHLEHVRPKMHGGDNRQSNLARSCHFCNFRKGPNIAGFDPDTGQMERLFNPRTDSWEEHFRRDNDRILGLTPVGRTTVFVLDMNDDDPRNLRGQFPD